MALKYVFRKGFTTITPELLHTSKILIIHLGPPLLPLPTGLLYVSNISNKSDSPIPSTNLERTIHLASEIVSHSGPGVLVASADILLDGELDLSQNIILNGDIVLFTLHSNAEYGKKHGVVITSKDDSISNILYQPSTQELKSHGVSEDVNLISGLVWFQPNVSESLLKLHCLSPIDGCTYMGADSGEESIRMSLYYDLLPAACSGVTKQEFVEGRCGKTLGRGRSSTSVMLAARKQVWSELRRYRTWDVPLRGVTHKYLPVWESFDNSEIVGQWSIMNDFYSENASVRKGNENVVILDSSLMETKVKTGFSINEGMVCEEKSTLHDQKLDDLACGEDVANMYYPTKLKIVRVMVGLCDNLHLHYKNENATFLGKPWKEALEKLGLTDDQVWPADIPEDKQILFQAKLFGETSSLVSLRDITSCVDIGKVLDWRRSIHEMLVCGQVNKSLGFPFQCKYMDLFKLAVAEGWALNLLQTLDVSALKIAEYQEGPKRTSKLASFLAMTADLLGCMAEGKGGLRSGPAHNKAFRESFKLLESGNVKEGLRELIEARSDWMERPSRMVRAARHYEGVVQLLIRQTVLSAKEQIKVDLKNITEKPNQNKIVVASCPARLDLSGGWTDTPPICYELGGKVVDLAIKVDDKKPIGCKVQRWEESSISITLGQGEILVVRSFDDMLDFCNPTAPGALIKCCLIATGIIDMSKGDIGLFTDKMVEICGNGLKIELWSDLPQGSGLGTSSILAGAVTAACWTAIGASYTRSDVVHAVLVVEQLLTTGGGWQDQVGGLHPGINLGESRANFQVSVQTTHKDCSEQFLSDLESRILLLYTGKPRLAKNLLQNVIRNWYSQDSEIVHCFKSNYKLAEECWKHVEDENVDGVGECLSKYWTIKKKLAPGSEPQLIKDVMDALKPFIVGGSLAGAGGGGFLAAVLKKDADRTRAIEEVRIIPGTERLTFHKATIDRMGIEVVVDNQEMCPVVPF